MATQQPRNIETLNGRHYDMDNQIDQVAYTRALAHVIAQQQQTINALQQQPPSLDPQQFQQLLNSLNPTAARPTGISNPVLSTPTRNVNYEEHVVPTGIEDLKGIDLPDAFNGRKSDVENFIVRLKAYFSAKPKNMRYTRHRILCACDLLKHESTRPWSDAVRKAIATGINNEYYFDNWVNFETEFKKRYGFSDPKQHYFRLLTRYTQFPKQDCKAYVDEFERLRQEAGTDKATAFHYLQRGTLALYRTALLLRETPPTDYDAWVAALKKRQEQMDAERGFRYESNFQPQRFQPQSQRQQYAAPPQKMPPGWGDAMDVDAIKHKGKQAKKPSTYGPRKGNPGPPQRPPNPRPTQPPAYQQAKPQASSSKPQQQRSKTPFYCFLCNGQGHYARDCKAQINQLDLQHIQAMAMTMEDTLSYHEPIQEEEEMFAPDEEEDEFNDEAGDLITFQDEPNPNELQDGNPGQGF
jgi:hypothetical protein